MTKQRLLIIEDESDIRELIAYNLELSGYEVLKVGNGKQGLKTAQDEHPDLIILDLMLPDLDGFSICKTLKKDNRYKRVPIIMLTARSDVDDMVQGLDSGADDYITKPFNPRVLLARVKAALRSSAAHRSAPSNEIISIHGIQIDPARHKVSINGKPIDLSLTEFTILRFLAENPGWVFSRNQIIDAVKGEDYPVTARSVDVQILGIRRKIGEKGDFIETVRGVGYRLKEDNL